MTTTNKTTSKAILKILEDESRTAHEAVGEAGKIFGYVLKSVRAVEPGSAFEACRTRELERARAALDAAITRSLWASELTEEDGERMAAAGWPTDGHGRLVAVS